MDKTTKNNPAAFQKMPPLSFYKIVKKTAKKVINGKIRAAINFLLSELLNFSCQLKRKNQFYCNLCKLESPYFLHKSNNHRILYHSICPNCNSRKRHRGLYETYKYVLVEFNSPKILHFAPEPIFYTLFDSFEYLTADLELTDVDLQLDIENIDYFSDSFDLILCNHVLEHVSDDNKAIKEIFRILKSIGIAIITVPGNWDRKKTIEYDCPDGNGHYRDYGLNFLSVLNKIFDRVEYNDLYIYNNFYQKPLGLTLKHDLVFLCYKN